MKVPQSKQVPWKPEQIKDDLLRDFLKSIVVCVQDIYKTFAEAFNSITETANVFTKKQTIAAGSAGGADLLHLQDESGGTNFVFRYNGAQAIELRNSINGAGNVLMSINESGIISTPKQSYCCVGNDTPLSVPANTDHTVVFNVVFQDKNNEFNVVNNRFTATESGIYVIHSGFTFDLNTFSKGNVVGLYIVVNGAIRIGNRKTVENEISMYLSIRVSGALALSPGDYVEIRLRSTVAGNYDTPWIYLTIAKVA